MGVRRTAILVFDGNDTIARRGNVLTQCRVHFHTSSQTVRKNLLGEMNRRLVPPEWHLLSNTIVVVAPTRRPIVAPVVDYRPPHTRRGGGTKIGDPCRIVVVLFIVVRRQHCCCWIINLTRYKFDTPSHPECEFARRPRGNGQSCHFGTARLDNAADTTNSSRWKRQSLCLSFCC